MASGFVVGTAARGLDLYYCPLELGAQEGNHNRRRLSDDDSCALHADHHCALRLWHVPAALGHSAHEVLVDAVATWIIASM